MVNIAKSYCLYNGILYDIKYIITSIRIMLYITNIIIDHM